MIGEKGILNFVSNPEPRNKGWIALSLTLLAMTVQGNGVFDGLA
jgi:hypothetical protein